MKKVTSYILAAAAEGAAEKMTDPGSCPRVGDTVAVRPVTLGRDAESPYGKLRTGKVVYVHPVGRFYTVEFDLGAGIKVRESFAAGSGRVTKEGLRNGGPGVPRFRMTVGI